MNGKVYLVGAGPGDKDLITCRGAELLARAEVIVHDYLAAPELLNLAPAGCRFIYAGKIASQHALPQEEINQTLIREAKAGHTVIRLKGGDPYIFGRGGEEALVLAEENIDFEVVPGVSSVIAASSAAGIPLTHRDFSSQVAIVTGKENPEKSVSTHDWSALAKLGTLAVVMGSSRLKEILKNLIENGKPPDTPVAFIQWGSTSKQKVVTGDLISLPSLVEKASLAAPALLIVGQVVRLREKLNWYEKRPLWGRKIMVTRTRNQASNLSATLNELGAAVWERPLIVIEEICPNVLLEHAIRDIKTYGWLVFTSPNGAEIFFKSLWKAGKDARSLSGLKIAVIGKGTELALKPYGLRADLCPSNYVAESLLEAFKGQKKTRLLLARAERAREILPQGLSALGFEVSLVPLYRTKPITITDFAETDLITLASASAAESLAEVVPLAKRAGYKIASIGPVTTKSALDFSFSVVCESSKATIFDFSRSIVVSFCIYLKRVKK